MLIIILIEITAYLLGLVGELFSETYLVVGIDTSSGGKSTKSSKSFHLKIMSYFLSCFVIYLVIRIVRRAIPCRCTGILQQIVSTSSA